MWGFNIDISVFVITAAVVLLNIVLLKKVAANFFRESPEEDLADNGARQCGGCLLSDPLFCCRAGILYAGDCGGSAVISVLFRADWQGGDIG